MLKHALLAAGAIVGSSAGQLSPWGANTKALCLRSRPHRAQVSVDAFAPAARSLRTDVRRQVFQQDPDQKRGPASDAERPP